MTVKRTYECDLCHDKLKVGSLAGDENAIGLYWTGNVIQQRKPADVDHHICWRCLSSLQKLETICGQGYACERGPLCVGDHK